MFLRGLILMESLEVSGVAEGSHTQSFSGCLAQCLAWNRYPTDGAGHTIPIRNDSLCIGQDSVGPV